MSGKKLKRMTRFTLLISWLVFLGMMYQNCGGGFSSKIPLSEPIINSEGSHSSEEPQEPEEPQEETEESQETEEAPQETETPTTDDDPPVTEEEPDTGANIGQGPSWLAPESIKLSPDGTIAYVVDSTSKAVFGVDLSNGRRFIISQNNGAGSGIFFQKPIGMTINRSGTTGYVADGAVRAIIAVNLTTGARSVVSRFTTVADKAKGRGPAFSYPTDIILNATEEVAYVTDFVGKAIFRVDMASGDRTIVSNTESLGSGPGFEGPIALSPHTDESRLFIADYYKRCVFVVDIDSGERQIISRYNLRGEGPNFKLLLGMTTGKNNRPLVVDGGQDSVTIVDAATGDRRFIYKNENQLPLAFPIAITTSADKNTAYIIDVSTKLLGSIDIQSGKLEIISRTNSNTN